MFELILSNGKGGHIAELLFPNSLEHLYWQFLQCFLLFEISPGGKDSEPEHGVACCWTSWGATELLVSRAELPAVTIQPPPTSPLVLSHFIIFSSLVLPGSRLISALLKPSQLQAWRLFWLDVWILMPVCLLHIYCQRSGSRWAILTGAICAIRGAIKPSYLRHHNLFQKDPSFVSFPNTATEHFILP